MVFLFDLKSKKSHHKLQDSILFLSLVLTNFFDMLDGILICQKNQNFSNILHIIKSKLIHNYGVSFTCRFEKQLRWRGGGKKTHVFYPPLTFPISQRVLKIFYSFLVQIISIFYSGFISNKIFGARASARATGQNILKIPRKKRQK